MTYIQLGVQNSSASNYNKQLTSGSPGANGDGINWPYNPNGQTPDFQINWNSNPPPTAQQVEATYEALVNWLQDNTGSPAFYNGSIMLLQMTVDIGQHLGSFSPSDQTQLQSFLSNQISTGGNQIFLQMIIQMSAQAAAVSSDNGQDGLTNATAFLTQLANATAGLTGIAPFNEIYGEAQNELNDDPLNNDSIKNWIFGSSAIGMNAHWIQVYAGDGNNPVYTWADDEGPNPNDNTINGQQPITFQQFTQDAQFALGSAITASTNTSVNNTINAYYETQIQALIAQFKGNPWALLVALMSLINDRDQDNGVGVNSYGGTLDLLKKANGIIQKMLLDISGTTPNATDFYAQLTQLKALVLNDPALSSVANQLESDIGTINGQTVQFTSNIIWTISPGYYNFPPGFQVQIGNTSYTVPANGVLYVPTTSTATIVVPSAGMIPLTFGQLAAMGNTSAISAQMVAWDNSNDPNGNGPNWTSTIMSNFENGVTGMQTLLNSPSAAIQQQIQNTTQTMQAEENFEKEAFDSITNVNQQVMKLVQSVMG